ncbi:BZ3500_MvSof-1268-A1-R1_Chr4-4g07519 [Microbotryum saponariae]|uniref:BZ3500_MvSof-1268-A1-R1_Chr4-4g07519 protein n=1 Tax=Microbotryum saponariae TaxID=289078 RepID=A0A2X0LKH3_9BASI|nr:BZ3500_MvSof-1268-A1-R1_Chr4-4g07519 [Microbotryum saponariae]SDA07180.1 BZ3501_MvSof-1269-A2-R1_Chr4-3g07227 [Microbotryum saponariae]
MRATSLIGTLLWVTATIHSTLVSASTSPEALAPLGVIGSDAQHAAAKRHLEQSKSHHRRLRMSTPPHTEPLKSRDAGTSGNSTTGAKTEMHSLAKRGSFSGRASFFDPGLGACGTHSKSSDFMVALNQAQYGDLGAVSSWCFQTITITYGASDPPNRTWNQITDSKWKILFLSPQVARVHKLRSYVARNWANLECISLTLARKFHLSVLTSQPLTRLSLFSCSIISGCPYGGLDMSPGLFNYFANPSVGIFYMSWSSGGSAPKSKTTTTTTTITTTTTTTTAVRTTTTTTTTSAYIGFLNDNHDHYHDDPCADYDTSFHNVGHCLQQPNSTTLAAPSSAANATVAATSTSASIDPSATGASSTSSDADPTSEPATSNLDTISQLVLAMGNLAAAAVQANA